MSVGIKSATRGLFRWRGGAVVAVVTLAIGIGVTTALYALLRVTVASLPGVPEVDRVARVYASSRSLGVERSQVALPEFDATLSRAASFSAIGAYADEDALLGSGTDARTVIVGYASPGFFRALGVPPSAGRVFSAQDLTGQPVVVLSQALWRRQFPDGRLTGATLRVDGIERAVIGVMPPEFHYGFVGISADLWLPLTRASRAMPSIVTVFARLRDGTGWPGAQAELAGMADRRGPWTWHAIPVADDTRYRAAAAIAGTLGPAALVLLIACVNVACMLLGRGVARERELTVRRALGATRLRVLRLLFVENLLLALISGGLGGAVAAAMLRVVAARFAAAQPSVAAALAVDLRLLPVTLGASVLACVLFGTIPALRLSKQDVAASLNGVPAPHRLEIAGYGARDVVVFAEVACAVGFVVWTAMLYTFFAQFSAVRTTFAADRVVAMRVPAPTVHVVAARVAAVPGVAGATISSGMLGGGSRERIATDGRPAAVVSRVPVGAEFFATVGVPLLRGRSFDAGELAGLAPVAVISESAARLLAPDGEAIGRRLNMNGRDAVVIGVSRDAIDYGPLGAAGGYAPDVYIPYAPSPTSPDAVVLARVSGDAHAALGAIAAAAQTPAGARPARPVVLSDDMKARNPSGAQSVVALLGSFAALTLLLAATGVFAVISQSVAQRTREFGIRLAIGATPRGVLALVLWREAKLIAAAAGTGVVFTMLATRALFVELTRVSAILPSAWIGAVTLSGGVAAVAVAIATFRIVRLEPAVVLRRT